MTEPPARALLPIFLDVSGRDVLVVGGGEVAERKVSDLLDAGASVRVVAKDVTPALEELGATGDVVLERRGFEVSDVDGAWLVVAATSTDAVQRDVAEACDRGRIFCLAVDDPKHATAYGGAVLRRGALTVSISTSGEAPALARLLREVLEQALPDDEWVAAATALREQWKANHTPMDSRFPDLVRAFKDRASSS